MKFTTSKSDHVKADIRCHFEFDNIFKWKRCFVGLHLDMSMRQIIIYLGFGHLFVEMYGPDRTSWGYATIDKVEIIIKFRGWILQKHTTNHIPDNFFNIGVTFDEDSITFFLWKLQLWNEYKMVVRR